MKSLDVIIVGGGAIGTASLHALAKRGVTRTILLEQNPRFGQGATGVWGSLLRQFSTRDYYTDRSAEAFRYYRQEFEADTGAGCGFTRTGGLYFFPRERLPQAEALVGLLRRQSPYAIEILDADRGRQRFPEYQWFDDDAAVFEPEAGSCCPYSTTDAWIQAARELGAEARANSRVVELLSEEGQVTGVRCADGEILRAGHVIIAGGPWTQEIVAPLGIQVSAIPRAIQVNRFQYRSSFATDRALPFFVDSQDESFGRPSSDGSFLGGSLSPGIGAPSGFRQPLSMAEAALGKRKLSRRLKWLRTASLIGGVRAVESYATSDRPVIERAARFSNLLLACGWSCSGFALAPVYAREIAENILGTAERIPGLPLSQEVAWVQTAL